MTTPNNEKNLIIKDVLEKDEPTWLDSQPQHVRYFVYLVRFAAVFGALYFFLLAISLMGDGFKGATGTTAGSLFGSDQNPVLGLMIGILATVLVQSSSTTTSVVVVLVANGIISVGDAIPMIMGANIGTSVTNTIVSLGFVQDKEAYSRGFAGATVHDMFNYLNVLVLLPLELIVDGIRDGKGGLLESLAEKLANQISEDTDFEAGDKYDEANPVEQLVDPILVKLIEIDSKVIEDHAKVFPGIPSDVESCASSFTFATGQTVAECEDSAVCDFCPDGIFNETVYDAAKETFDDQKMIDGGWLADYDDTTGGIIAVVLSLVILIGALYVIVKVLTTFVKGPAKKILSRALNYNFPGGGYVSIVLGAGITLFVQSSSITTSLLTPLVAADALQVENMLPFTLGANIGTTGTGLLAAISSGSFFGYQIAFVHLLFNMIGVLIWYPLPVLRKVPITAAKKLGSAAGMYKPAPLVYLLLAFLVYPLALFALSSGWYAENTGLVVLSSLVTMVLIAAHMVAYYWFYYQEGHVKVAEYLKAREEAETKKDTQDKVSV